MEENEARLPTGNVTKRDLVDRALESTGLGELGVDADALRVFVGEAEVGTETIGLQNKDGTYIALVIDVPQHPGAVYVPAPGTWLLFKLSSVVEVPDSEEAVDEG